jgi:hypothetical protein
MPNRNTKDGTMMIPPPTPTNPLKIPAIRPVAARISIVCIVMINSKLT